VASVCGRGGRSTAGAATSRARIRMANRMAGRQQLAEKQQPSDCHPGRRAAVLSGTIRTRSLDPTLVARRLWVPVFACRETGMTVGGLPTSPIRRRFAGSRRPSSPFQPRPRTTRPAVGAGGFAVLQHPLAVDDSPCSTRWRAAEAFQGAWSVTVLGSNTTTSAK